MVDGPPSRDAVRDRPRAMLFDFNGTLSLDEDLLCGLFCDVFAEHGKPLDEAAYFTLLAGRSTYDIVWQWLGSAHPAVDAVIEKRFARYRLLATDGATVPAETREAVRLAASHAAVGIVSGATRSEIEFVLEGAGLSDAVTTVVAFGDVVRGKPDPDGYELALRMLNVSPEDAFAFEDTDLGIRAAKAAGIRCLGVRGTVAPERLRGADEIVPAIEPGIVRRLLSLDYLPVVP